MSREEVELVDDEWIGRHVPYDPTLLEVPDPMEYVSEGRSEYELMIKREDGYIPHGVVPPGWGMDGFVAVDKLQRLDIIGVDIDNQHHSARRSKNRRDGGTTANRLSGDRGVRMAAEEDDRRSSQVIHGKLNIPDVPVSAAPRERLDRLLCELVDAHRLVAVTATAGAGKSVAVAHASGNFGRPVAWLTVDGPDAAPGRLLTYVEAALGRQLPSVRGVATGALAARIPHAEAAGLLAEACSGTEIVLVLDDLERLRRSQKAWDVVDSIVRYAPATLRVILISRRALPTAASSPAIGGALARVSDSDLAFSVEEARIALERLGRSGTDAPVAVAATGGWVTGVLFDAWRSRDALPGAGGGPDGIHDYLAAHILGELDVRDREFLITTALLDEVTVDSAVALGVDDAAQRLGSLRLAHIPAQWSADSLELRCHSQFREHLRQLLDHRGHAVVCDLHAAHGRLLAEKGLHEEAVEELLTAGALRDAAASAKHAIVGVLERLDFTIADRWIEALSHAQPVNDVGFAEAELMLALARDRERDGVRIADGLAAIGQRDQLAATSERAAALMAWCYAFVGRVDEAHVVLDSSAGGPAVAIVRYALALADPGSGPPRPDLTGGPLDGVLRGVDYVTGRLSELADDPPSPWMGVAMGPGRIGALRATGRTAEALQQYQAARRGGFFGGVLDSFVGPDVLLDAGRVDDARVALARGRKLVLASGSPLLTALHHIAMAKFALRADRDPACATAALEAIDRDPAASTYQLVHEFAQTWRGLAALIKSDDHSALASLQTAVTSMQASQHILELPTAAVYLAEAEWRAGNEDAADSAADLALQAAHQHGSNHILLQALGDFPAVVARRIDAEPGADTAWHAIGRALVAQGVRLPARISTAVELAEFGRTAIILDGNEVRPRIAKCYELLGFLAARAGVPASRADLLDGLFDAREDESARAYLRQTIVGVRRLLPHDAVTVSEDGRVGLCHNVVLASESTRIEQDLAAGLRLQGGALVAAIERALAPMARGVYFPGVRSAWVDERRAHLADYATTARAAAADAAYAEGRYDDAKRFADVVLAADPLRETVWRTSMRIRSAVGDYDGVIATFAECERSLTAAGIRPAPSTRVLLDDLRR